jgi:hypothetical protein
MAKKYSSNPSLYNDTNSPKISSGGFKEIKPFEYYKGKPMEYLKPIKIPKKK